MFIGERGADDAGVVLQLRGNDLHGVCDRQARKELVRLAAHAAADDDQVGPEIALQRQQIGVDAMRPFLPRQILFPARLGRGARLGFLAFEFEVAELAVRHQVAVDEQRRADSRAERDEDHEPGAAAAGAESHLGVARGIGVVDDRHTTSRRAPEQRARIGSDPAAVDIRRREKHAVAHRRRHAAADRSAPGEVPRNALHQAADGGGRRRLRRFKADARRQQPAGAGIDRRALDAAAADVDAEHAHVGATCRVVRARGDRTRRSGACW